MSTTNAEVPDDETEIDASWRITFADGHVETTYDRAIAGHWREDAPGVTVECMIGSVSASSLMSEIERLKAEVAKSERPNTRIEEIVQAGMVFADQVEVLLSTDPDMPTAQTDYDDTENALTTFRTVLNGNASPAQEQTP